ncbi:MAG: erythromycin esterase family protein [Longimicrobiales bacterium]
MSNRPRSPVIVLLGLMVTACVDQPTDLLQQLQIPAAAAVWIERNSLGFQHVELSASLDELEPLRAMMGSARMVALGEATHGTREFFQMKARLLRFLVERMGFSAFAIEASWPEANRLDRYVRTGEGDPAALLSGLYFWTWNTEEVMEMIRWMRAYNVAGGRVGFYGFDMQYPGMAVDNVLKFIRVVDPSALPDVSTRLYCVQVYANGPNGRFAPGRYGEIPPGSREGCLTDLTRVYDDLVRNKLPYEARTSAAEYARALRSARVVIQWEGMESQRLTRDAAMAENALWLLEQLGPDGKIVLWAHNGHVSKAQNAMGPHLRAALGGDFMNIGFSFRGGSFTAVTQQGQTFLGLNAHTATELIPHSYTYYLAAANRPQFVLDLRGRAASSDSTSWLLGPRSFRSIGCCFNPALPQNYWYDTRLPAEFDAVIHFQTTNPSRLLPFLYPTSF